jgi:NADH:ubiquinone oxidoreductase subunit 4 (subunit M)
MLLTSIFSTICVSLVILFFIDAKNYSLLRFFALSTSGLTLVLSSILLTQFDSNIYYFQNIVTYSLGSSLFNLSYSFGIDGISIFFFFLSSLLIFICVLFIWNESNYKNYVLTLLTIELFLLIIFSVLDLFIFYIFFEAILIPMYLMIGFWGSRERKIRAAYLFFFILYVDLL